MQTTSYGKHSLASGLIWSVLDPHGDGKHKQIKQWREQGQTHGVVVDIEGEAMYGRSDASAQGHVSVAALAAKHPDLRGKTALVIIEIPAISDEQESSVLVVGLNRGIVELDRLVLSGEIAAVRSGFQTKLGKQFETFGEGDGVGAIANELSLDDLFKSGKPQRSKVGPLRSGRGTVIALGVLVFCLMLGGGWAWWTSSEEARRIEEQARQDAARTPQVLYQQSIDLYLQKPFVGLANAMVTVREALKDFPVVLGGWTLTKINCNESGCTALWRRLSDAGGTLDDFRAAALPGWGPVTPASQTEVSHAIPIVLPTSSFDRSTWPQMNAWRDDNLVLWQRLAGIGWRADLEQPKLMAVPAEVAGSPDELRLAAMPEAIRAAEFSIVGMPFWFANDDPESPMLTGLLAPQTALLGDIQLDVVDGIVKFSVKGLIHVQN